MRMGGSGECCPGSLLLLTGDLPFGTVVLGGFGDECRRAMCGDVGGEPFSAVTINGTGNCGPRFVGDDFSFV